MAAPQKTKSRAKKGGMKPFYYLLGLVAVVGGVLIGFSVLKGGSGSKAATEAPPSISRIENPEELVQKAKGVRRGQTTAPVRLTVFADYMCPGCAAYTTIIGQPLKREFIDTGKVVEIFYDFPLGGSHIYSFLAARAARCAEDQGKFWQYHDNLFEKQRDWSFEPKPPVDVFKKYASDLTLDRKKFDACIDSEMHSDLVDYNHQLGQQAGVGSTPTVFINSKASENPLNWDVLRAEILAALPAGR